MKTDKDKAPEKPSIRDLLAVETSAMAAHALSYGQKIPRRALRVLLPSKKTTRIPPSKNSPTPTKSSPKSLPP